MVRVRCGLLESDDEPTTRAKVAEVLARHVPDESERHWIEPALLALLGVETSGAGSEQLFAAWRSFFERLAASAPVVMIFEDHHFADAGLLDFVDHLLEWSRTVPIYVVTLARPELLERRPNWGAGKRNFTSLYLEPLPEAAMRELLAGLVPGLPETAVRAIVARADGVPLYAVETVRMLLAQGRLAPDPDGVYRPTGDLTSLAVPETLTALIASRLDGLPPEERALVADAAVLGQSFTPAGLAAVSGLPEHQLEPRLRNLVRRELLVLEADPRSPERGQYAFVQALIREVAYNTLARADRKTRHLAAARFFESLGSDELAGALAGHYLAAHQNATEGPEADALAAQARITLKAAAERAAALGSHDQAVTFLEQALTVTTDPADEAELLEQAGESAPAATHHDQAEALLRRAVDRQRARGDRPATVRAITALGRARIQSYRTEQAQAVLEPAAEEFGDLGANPAFTALLGQLARAYFMRDLHDRAIAVADRALAAAEHADLVALVADTLVTKGSALASLGRRYEGVGTVETGLRLAGQHGLARTALRARVNLGAFQAASDPGAALEIERAGLHEAQRLGERGWALLLLTNAAEDATWIGDWDWVLPELDALLGLEFEGNDRTLVLVFIARLRAWRGETVDAVLDEIERLAGSTSDPSVAAQVAGVRADWTLVLGEPAAAAATYRRAAHLTAEFAPTFDVLAARASVWARDAPSAAADLEALKATGVHGPAIEARSLSIRAGLAALDGREADALLLYHDAVRRFRDLGVRLDEALTAIEMATLLDPSQPEVADAVVSARQILTRLGARPFLERLEAAVAHQPERAASHTKMLQGADQTRDALKDSQAKALG
jgi:tetratricopeptide (TPR) repeat protein